MSTHISEALKSLNKLNNKRSLKENEQIKRKRSLKEAKETHHWEVWTFKNSAGRERRPTTIDDRYNDLNHYEFNSDETDLEVLKDLAIDNLDWDEDYVNEFETAEDLIDALNEADYDGGEPVMHGVKKDDKMIVDNAFDYFEHDLWDEIEDDEDEWDDEDDDDYICWGDEDDPKWINDYEVLLTDPENRFKIGKKYLFRIIDGDHKGSYILEVTKHIKNSEFNTQAKIIKEIFLRANVNTAEIQKNPYK